jgi:hypothetical protein
MDNDNLKRFIVGAGLVALLFIFPPLGALLLLALAIKQIVDRRERQAKLKAEREMVDWIIWRGRPENQVGMSIEEANYYRRAAHEQRMEDK